MRFYVNFESVNQEGIKGEESKMIYGRCIALSETSPPVIWMGKTPCRGVNAACRMGKERRCKKGLKNHRYTFKWMLHACS